MEAHFLLFNAVKTYSTILAIAWSVTLFGLKPYCVLENILFDSK